MDKIRIEHFRDIVQLYIHQNELWQIEIHVVIWETKHLVACNERKKLTLTSGTSNSSSQTFHHLQINRRKKKTFKRMKICFAQNQR